MKIVFFTIVLDGMPWLPMQLAMMQRLKCDWLWTVAEGVADNVADTGWCKKIPPRLSNDGTGGWLREISDNHPNVFHFNAELWPGKAAMCNQALSVIREPCLLWQLDADELWESWQVEAMLELFENSPDRHWASFWCDYVVGPNLHITSRDTYGNHSAYEWLRVWRFTPGMKFASHEPPRLGVEHFQGFTNGETERHIGMFLHPAYMLRKQVAFKEQYYGYAGAVTGWERLQANKVFPCYLREFFPWVKDGAVVDRMVK